MCKHILGILCAIPILWSIIPTQHMTTVNNTVNNTTNIATYSGGNNSARHSGGNNSATNIKVFNLNDQGINEETNISDKWINTNDQGINTNAKDRIIPRNITIKTNSRKILLSSIQILIFNKNQNTNSRRTIPRPQMTCVSGCDLIKPEPSKIVCKNQGIDDNEIIIWDCTVDGAPDNIGFENIAVSCEGYSSPLDKCVLVGSCALKYSLHNNNAAVNTGSSGVVDHSSGTKDGSNSQRDSNNGADKNDDADESENNDNKWGNLILIIIISIVCVSIIACVLWVCFFAPKCEHDEALSSNKKNNENYGSIQNTPRYNTRQASELNYGMSSNNIPDAKQIPRRYSSPNVNYIPPPATVNYIPPPTVSYMHPSTVSYIPPPATVNYMHPSTVSYVSPAIGSGHAHTQYPVDCINFLETPSMGCQPPSASVLVIDHHKNHKHDKVNKTNTMASNTTADNHNTRSIHGFAKTEIL